MGDKAVSESIAPSRRAADLVVAGLSLWVAGRHGGESEDYWEGNWLDVIARYRAGGSRVAVAGPIVHLSELAALLAGCERMAAGAVTETGLYCMEPNLKIELWRVPNGQLIGKTRITPDHKSEVHDFGFALEPGELPAIAASCRDILARYPLRGKAGA